MFFNILEKIDITFPNHLAFGNFVVNFDNGWSISDNYIYKGYVDNGLIRIDSEEDIDNFYSSDGNFCIIYFKQNRLQIITGLRQKFPIFDNGFGVTNLYKNKITYQGNLVISSNDIKEDRQKKFVYNNLSLSNEEIVTEIDALLNKKINSFKFDQPLKIFLTGGLDTLLLTAYVLKNKIPYELIDCEHVEMDHFVCHHRNYILKNFWAYSTIQHWKNKNILLTGGHGDESMLRDPIQAKLIFDFHGENLLDILNSKNDFYHKLHFLKKENLDTYVQLDGTRFEKEIDLKNHLIDRSVNDYQHWHLGNTIFFSPLNDIELLNLFLNLSYTEMKSQLLDGKISRLLIEINRPGLLKFLSPQKNFNYFEKTADLYEGKIDLEKL